MRRSNRRNPVPSLFDQMNVSGELRDDWYYSADARGLAIPSGRHHSKGRLRAAFFIYA